MNPRDRIIKDSVVSWFEKAVLGLNLCPFAHKPYRSGRLLFAVTGGSNHEQVLSDLYVHLDRMDQDDKRESVILIVPDCLARFDDYLVFLDTADALLVQEGWEGVYQIAGFHPDYRFAGTAPGDRENWTNRSPFPLLHLLREQSITAAVERHADSSEIPLNNIRRLNDMTEHQMISVFGRRFTQR